MDSFAVGAISVEVHKEPVSILDKPDRDAEEQPGIAANPASFSTLDGWLGRFGFFAFEGRATLTGKFYWHKTPLLSPYDRLERAGTISVVNSGGNWVAPLRALKVVAKPYPTLHRVAEEDLDHLAGSSFVEFVSSLGAVEVERYGDLVPDAGPRVANGLGIAVPAGQVVPLMGMIAVTRPLALVKRFGEEG